MMGAMVFCLGGGLQTAAQNLGFLYSGRLIAGVGVGVMVMIIPLYQAEIAHPSIRGRITGLQQFMLAIGATVAGKCLCFQEYLDVAEWFIAWTTYGTNLHLGPTNNNQWRIPLGIQIVPAGVLAILIMLFPESPRWLIDHGKLDQGLKTLAQLHASGDMHDAWVRCEYEQIEAAIAHEHENSAKGYHDLFTNKSSFRRLVLVAALQASVQMTGVSAIQYFSPQIYATLKIPTQDALKYQGVSNILSTLAILCTILFIDRLGRRWPLIIGNLINCLCFIIVTAAIASFPNASPSAQRSLGWAFIATNWMYQISFSFTCGSLSWIIPAEIFDTKTRSKGVSIGAMVSFAFNTLIGQVTSPAIDSISWRYFLVFVVCNFTNAVFFWAFMPETAKRPLEEMNALFSGSSWFVPTMGRRGEGLGAHDLEHRLAGGKEMEMEKEKAVTVEDSADL